MEKKRERRKFSESDEVRGSICNKKVIQLFILTIKTDEESYLEQKHSCLQAHVKVTY